MVGSIDRVIQTSLEVKCLQEECSDWIGCIKDYKVCRNIYIYFYILLDTFHFHCGTTMYFCLFFLAPRKKLQIHFDRMSTCKLQDQSPTSTHGQSRGKMSFPSGSM